MIVQLIDVKQGQIVHCDLYYITDEFSNEGALNKFLGLIEYTEEELIKVVG